MNKINRENRTCENTLKTDTASRAWNAPKLRRISASTGTEGKKVPFPTEGSPASPWGPS